MIEIICWGVFIEGVLENGPGILYQMLHIDRDIPGWLPLGAPSMHWLDCRYQSDWLGVNHRSRHEKIANDECPECDGELDTGYECNKCGFDARPEVLIL